MKLSLRGLFNVFSWRRPGKSEAHDTRLCRAVRSGSLRQVRSLLKEGDNPNTWNGNHLTPLHQAAYWGETEMVKLLLAHGAKVDVDNGKGWTALHSAAISGGMKNRREIIDMLLAAGADPDKQDKLGWTPKDYMKLWEEDAAAADKLKQHLDMLQGKPSLLPLWRPHKTFVPQHG